MKRSAGAWLVLAMALVSGARAAEPVRTYHPLTIAQITSDDPVHWKHLRTHVHACGWPTYVKREADGDLHVRICDSMGVERMDRARCFVAEGIPKMQIAVPKVGEYLCVDGIFRFDGEHGHGWCEVHPVEAWRKAKP